MATKKKLLQAAAGSAGGAALNVEEVFSTYLFDGNGGSSTISINNGIDLSGEGGLVWTKTRDDAYHHMLNDTERGVNSTLYSSATSAESTNTNLFSSFNSDGFTLGVSNNSVYSSNSSASWTFRKAPKFFDVVTFTGTGSAQTISHNLGSVPGMIMVKRTNSTAEWRVYHSSLGYTKYLALHNSDAATTDASNWQATPTSSVFSVGSDSEINASGSSYVAYLFAHNNGDGDFGPTGDQDIIKCGGWSSSGSQTVNLGFEPQWIMIKPSSTTANWAIYDVMRGQVVGGTAQELYPNLNNAEGSGGLFAKVSPTPTGFSVTSGYNADHIYIAIRRGPMAVPESATDVFEANSPAGNNLTTFKSGNTSGSLLTDFVIGKPRIGSAGYGWLSSSRLNQKILYPHLTAAEEGSASQFIGFDTQSGINWNSDWVTTNDSEYLTYHWKRAPNFFDVVAYSGTGVARTISHNLGAVPEMMWVKSRTNTRNWAVYHKGADASPESGLLRLDTTTAFATGITTWNNTQPTASVFSVGTRNETNNASEIFIAYLFASLDGVSKVGSYTGNGSTQNIDCGFSSGARFVLIKRTDSTGDWYVWDTERGIVAANDPHLSLNTTAAEVTTDDSVDPVSSGFAVNQVAATNINVSSATYIFYAIA